MITNRFTISFIITFLLILFTLSGCLNNEPVRHLSSDASLIISGHTTREQIMSFMGSPAVQEQGPGNTETWIYYQMNKSLMRKAPHIGHRLGYEEYDVVTVTFIDDVVQESRYRLLSEEEFRELGISVTEKAEEE